MYLPELLKPPTVLRNDMTNAFDYKGQPSIWTRDSELKMITLGKKIGLKRREQLREKEIQGHHPLQARKNKK